MNIYLIIRCLFVQFHYTEGSEVGKTSYCAPAHNMGVMSPAISVSCTDVDPERNSTRGRWK